MPTRPIKAVNNSNQNLQNINITKDENPGIDQSVSKVGIKEIITLENIYRHGKKIINNPAVWLVGSAGLLFEVYRRGIVNNSFLQFIFALMAVNAVIDKTEEIALSKKIISSKGVCQKILTRRLGLSPIIAIWLYQSFLCSTPILAAAGFMALMSIATIALESIGLALQNEQKENA